MTSLPFPGDRLAEEYHLASQNVVLSAAPPLPPPPALQEPEETDHPDAVPLGFPRKTSTPLDQVLLNRSSCWNFDGQPLTQADLSQLLYWSCGSKQSGGRMFPSAGNLASTQVYPLLLEDAGSCAAGLYRYDPLVHQLIPQRVGQFRKWLGTAILQPDLNHSGLALILVSNFKLLRSRYPNRFYRLGLLDCGHVSQNIYLVAASMGLGCISISGYLDNEINEALGLDGLDQACLLVTLIGHPIL